VIKLEKGLHLKILGFSLLLCVSTLKKQLTADERRYTPINQRLGENIGLTKRVNQYYLVLVLSA